MDFKESIIFEDVEAGSVITAQGSEAFQDIAIGSFAGIIGKIIEYPFDTIKVRLQSQPYNNTPGQSYAGPLDCFRRSIQKDGIWSLYRGMSAPLVGAAVENSSLFFSYRVAQKVLLSTYYQSDKALPIVALILCGAASGAFTSLLLTPIELIKCKMQVPLQSGNSIVRGTGPLTLISAVFKHRGLLGFWHGQLGTFIRETGGSAAWFGSYESVSLAFRNARPPGLDDRALPIWQQLLAGATAGMTYNFVFYPADTIKSRMQTEDVSKAMSSKRNTFGSVGRALWHEQGLRGLYRGCGITVGRAAPSSAVVFTIYDSMKRAFT